MNFLEEKLNKIMKAIVSFKRYFSLDKFIYSQILKNIEQ